MKRASGRHPLEFKGIAKSYDGHKVIAPFTASVERGEKIALLGRNGAGKTTLLKSLIRSATGYIDDAERRFVIDSGTVVWGHETAVGYFAQDHTDSIVKGVTVVEWLQQFDPQATQEELRGLLGRPGFALVAVSTIALGIGATGAIWSCGSEACRAWRRAANGWSARSTRRRATPTARGSRWGRPSRRARTRSPSCMPPRR